MAKVSIRTGAEGPHHDLYHFFVITFTSSKGEVTKLHHGLQNFIILPDGTRKDQFEFHFGYNSKSADIDLEFHKSTGITVERAEKIFYK